MSARRRASVKTANEKKGENAMPDFILLVKCALIAIGMVVFIFGATSLFMPGKINCCRK